MRLLQFSLCAFFLLVYFDSAFPHGGGLDSYGCHHNRKQGGYHCHRGQFAGQSFGSKDEMLQQLKRSTSEKVPAKNPAGEKELPKSK